MDYRELHEVLGQLNQATNTLEEMYTETGYECTEETEQMEECIDALKELLASDGIDMLGAWLKAKEDRKAALKAEKDFVARQIAAADRSIEFIKSRIHTVLVATGRDRVKGARGYSFATTISSKTEVVKDVLKDRYQDRVEEAIRAADVPEYIGVTLTASSTKAKEDGVLEEDEGIFATTEKPSVRFTKPRASKEA